MAEDPTRGGLTLDRPRSRPRGTGRPTEGVRTLGALDDLTGLRNQRALWRELRRRASAESVPLCVVMIDVDHLDDINAQHGRDVGDAVLRTCGAVLRGAGMSPRLAFRHGGDRFVLLVPGAPEVGRATAEEVRAQIEGQRGALPGVTVSCGVATLDRPGEPWIVLDRADAALAEAKVNGRNAVVTLEISAVADEVAVEYLEVEAPRRAALALSVATEAIRTTGGPADDLSDVLLLCEAIGRRMGVEGPDLDQLLAASQLHDLGKVAVPPEIFSKPGPLADDERAMLDEHTVIGERILRSVPEMAEVATIVRHSREHFDGSGYPDGLAGDQIPLASRIVLCAAAFRAMRSPRPYRAARSADEALVELEAFAGTQFDPAVVAALAGIAADTRSADADPRVVTILPRSRRLAALLLAMTVGTGTAFAAIPEARDLVESILGTASTPSDVVSTNDGSGLSFGRIGELLSVPPGTLRANGRGDGDRADDRPARRSSRAASAADGTDPNGARGEPRLEDTGDRPGPKGELPAEPPATPGPGQPGIEPAPGPQQPPPTVRGSTPQDPPQTAPPPEGIGGSDPGTEPVPAPLDPAPTGKGTPPRKPAEPPSRRDDAKADGPAGRPEDPGRPNPPGHASA